MTVKLTADDLRGLAAFVDSLNSSTKHTGVRAAADGWAYVAMDHWPHSLTVEHSKVQRHPADDDPADVYVLLVESAQ